MKLGVNVDHVATLRQSRGTLYPDPVVAAMLCEHAGCDSVVVHLREDRRHIQDRDVMMLARALTVPINLEMSVNKNIVDIAVAVKPAQATLVPERRQELTTEGGIDLIIHYRKVASAASRLKAAGIQVSLFIDPDPRQIKKAKEIGADLLELNTGKYSEAHTPPAVR
ncbi:MAG: pyridoxine 5'-phosphate synthase, partial [Candidatus Omnitrophica bacterium]|nr:pyridoxine 5'-phosphate synthase [Candidatus Omnitrophota bacterium]